MLLLASLSFVTIFDFQYHCGSVLVYLRIVARNHWRPDTKAYTATEAYTKILEIKALPARSVQRIEFRSTVHLLFKFITPPTES